MNRLVQVSSLAALVLAAAVVVWLVATQGRAPGPQEIPTALDHPDAPAAPLPRELNVPHGGVFAGVVVDHDGKPVPDATVLLVAYDNGTTGRPRGLPQPAPSAGDAPVFDPSSVSVVGFRTAAESRTDLGGRFRVAADAASSVHLVCAYHPGFVPNLLPVDRPSEDLRVELLPAGRLVGHVVDDTTGRAVAGAKVAIYLQQRTALPPAQNGTTPRPAADRPALSPYAVAQQWVATELGQRVWGLDANEDSSLVLVTDAHGDFSFGPIGDQVQLEVVITHPDYAWQEFDQVGEEYVKRIVVEPGQTVERTYRLDPGKSISGRVIDAATQKGVPDVEVLVDHVAQYHQHWWYRVKSRRARTGHDGAFKVGGLSWGPYTARLRHSGFGEEFIPKIPEGATNLVWEVSHLGGIDGTIEGFEDTGGAAIDLVLESVEENPEHGRRAEFRPPVDKGGHFEVQGVQPGRYRAWLQGESKSSEPQVIEVSGLDMTPVTFELGGGGRVELSVYDAGGRPLDPAEVELVKIAEQEGQEDVTLGRYVTRKGHLVANGVAPGRYRALVSSGGYLQAETEPFTVVTDRTTMVGDVSLRQRSWLRIKSVVGPDGRTPTSPVRIEIQTGGQGEFQPLQHLGGGPVAIEPGTLTLRARTDDGATFEQQIEVEDGQTVPVDIRLVRPR